MSSSIVVLVESRKLPEISDLMYQMAKNELARLNLGSSRITVPQVLDLPIAARLVIEATRSREHSKWHKPSAYILLGGDYSQDLGQIEYQTILQSILSLQMQFHIPMIPAIYFLEHHPQSVEALEKACLDVVAQAVQSCWALLELQQKLTREEKV